MVSSIYPTRPVIISRTKRFVVGEYVSIKERGKMHTYRVMSVSYI